MSCFPSSCPMQGRSQKITVCLASRNRYMPFIYRKKKIGVGKTKGGKKETKGGSDKLGREVGKVPGSKLFLSQMAAITIPCGLHWMLVVPGVYPTNLLHPCSNSLRCVVLTGEDTEPHGLRQLFMASLLGRFDSGVCKRQVGAIAPFHSTTLCRVPIQRICGSPGA